VGFGGPLIARWKGLDRGVELGRFFQVSGLTARNRDEWRASSADASWAASTPQRDKFQVSVAAPAATG